MAKEYSREIAATIAEFMESEDWNYKFDEKRGVFRFGVVLGSKLKSIRYYLSINEDDYIVYAVSPIGANVEDPDQMSRVNEFLHRANYDLKYGNFEIDCTDGEVRYKCYVDCEYLEPNHQIVKESICLPAEMFKRYGDGFLQVLFTDVSPGQVIDVCEGRK